MMKPVWINQNAWDSPIDHYSYSWTGGVVTWVKVNFTDPKNPPYLVDSHGYQWTWPDNLISDGNSSPGCLRWLFPTDYCEPAPFLHDYAYRTGTLLTRRFNTDSWKTIIIDRDHADDLIYEGWFAAGGQPARCKLAYMVLRSFGWMAWKGK